MILSRKNLKNVIEGLNSFDVNVAQREEPFRSDGELKNAINKVKRAIEKKLKQRPK